jgi:hypothetical protein
MDSGIYYGENMSEKKVKKSRKILSLVTGVVIVIIGILTLAGGAAILVYNKSADDKGFHWSNTYEVRSSTYAFTVEMKSLSAFSLYARLGAHLFGPNNAVEAKWSVETVDYSGDLFIGLTKISNGVDYLSKIETEKAVWSLDGFFDPQISMNSLTSTGSGLGGPLTPAWKEDFWSQWYLGRGQPLVEYPPFWNTDADDKYMIIMHSDGTKNVDVDLKLGFNFPVFRWLPYRLIPLGVIICTVGVLFMVTRKS